MLGFPECGEHAADSRPVDGLRPLATILGPLVAKLRGSCKPIRRRSSAMDDRCPEATRAGPGNLLPHCSGSPLDVGHLNAPSIMQARDQPAVQRAQPLRFGQPRSGLEAPRHFGNALGPGVDRRLRKVRRPVSTVFDCRHRHVTRNARAIDEVRHRGVDHVG